MDRLLIASEFCVDSGSRRYVSGLFDRRAGRGLDGYTNAWLASLADRFLKNHLRRQALSACIDPFHAVSQSRTLPRLAGLDGGDLAMVCVEARLVAQHAP
jgi:hypothetical protein